MSAAITLTVPMPPNLANGRMHHMVKHKIKCGYWALLDVMFGFDYDGDALRALTTVEERTKNATLRREIRAMRDVAGGCVQVCRVAAPRRWPSARIHSVMHLGAAMDDGNAMNRHKWVEDWLKTRGYIVDDRKTCLTWDGFPEQIIKRDDQYRIELTLSPLPPTQDRTP